MKKFWKIFEQFLVLFMMWSIVYSYMVMFFVPYIGVTGYFVIVILTAPRFMLYNQYIRWLWDHPEACPTVEWCEKLTIRLFENGNRKN